MGILKFVFVSILLPVATFAQQAQGDPASGIMSVLPMMLIMFGIIYFFMIKPEQKKQKQRQKMIDEMKKGDKVLTVGGIFGKISGIKGDLINLKIAENVIVDVSKTAISSVVPKNDSDKKKIESEKK